MLTRPFKIVPQSDEGTLGPGSTGWLSPGDCPGVSIQSGVPWASAPFSISCDASFLSEPTLGFRGAELPLPEVGIQEIFREVKVRDVMDPKPEVVGTQTTVGSESITLFDIPE